ncbi:MAG: sulfite exporter TauE/SafE family protein [Planctomycetales bacterium]|nr:sulfite exporter TauE/SafE family protein [Planctomycetales bacterium]
MAIPVTCPGCLKRFNVSDKFAGKTGPCPNCQKQIKIPELSEQVIIHAPEVEGPKDSKGGAILKPIRRSEVKLSPPVIIAAGVSIVAVLAIALGLGLSGQQPATWLLATGSLALALPLVFVGYWFLRDDELQGYQGRELWVRCIVCAIAFSITWGVYSIVPAYVSGYSSMQEFSGLDMAIFIPVMILIGSLASLAALELEYMTALLHYVLYFSVTFFLAWLSGAQLSEPLSNGKQPPTPEPSTVQTAPANPQPNQQPTTPAAEPPEKQIPNLLQ